MVRRYGINDKVLPKNDKTLLDVIPDVVPNYMKEDKTKDGIIDLDYMLHIYVKEIVSNYTAYFLYAKGYIDSNYVKSETYADTIIGVMVIEKNVNKNQR